MANINAHAAARAAMRRMAAFVGEPAFNDAPRENICVRLERLEELWLRFNEVQQEVLDAIVGEDIAAPEENMIQMENLYLDTKTAFRRRIDQLRQQELDAQAPIVAPQPQQIAVQVQMPVNQQDIKNSWGEFDGTITKWQGFHDRFVAAIHDNEQVSPAYKFSLLKKSLTGKALKDFGEWQLTDANYLEAWQRLEQRYDRKYDVCRELLRRFFRLQSLQGEPSKDDLQRMSNVTHETLRQLRAQGLPVEHWDMVIVHSLHERLDSETAKAWELQRNTETPTATEMLEFLDKQAAASSNTGNGRRFRSPESVHSDRSQRNDASRFNRFQNERNGQRKDSQQKASTSKSTTDSQSSGTGASATARLHHCELCQGEHQLYNCQKFLALNLRSRKDYVRTHNLCENCLKRGHTIKYCYQRPCPRCPNDQMHNSVICPSRDVNKAAAVMSAEGQPASKRKAKKD